MNAQFFALAFLAALQARLGIEAGLWTEKDMAQVAVRCRAAAVSNPAAQVSGDVLVEDLLEACQVSHVEHRALEAPVMRVVEDQTEPP